MKPAIKLAAALATVLISMPAPAFAAVPRLTEIQGLQEVILQSIRTPAPYSSSTAKDSVFHTSYDWHSSVHAHWALLSSARITGDTKLVEFVRTRLSDEALKRERKYLAKDPTFEMPYGRAWLLLLMSELARQPGGLTQEGLKLQAQTEAEILDYLKTHPLPENSGNFTAAHQSWLLTFWLLQRSNPDASTASALEVLRHSKIDPVRARIPSVKYTGGDFLYLPAVLALIDRDLAYPEDNPPPLVPPFTIENAHTLGAAAMRLWPFAVECSAAQAGACALFDRRLEDFIGHRDYWQENFEHISHWVPQFVWMAIWLEQGAP